MTTPPSAWSLLRTYLAPQRLRVRLLALLLFSSIGLQLGAPQAIQALIDAAAVGAPSPILLGAAGLFLALAVAQQAAGIATLYVGEQVGWRATNALRADLAGHLLQLDLGLHRRRTPAAGAAGAPVAYVVCAAIWLRQIAAQSQILLGRRPQKLPAGDSLSRPSRSYGRASRGSLPSSPHHSGGGRCAAPARSLSCTRAGSSPAGRRTSCCRPARRCAGSGTARGAAA